MSLSDVIAVKPSDSETLSDASPCLLLCQVISYAYKHNIASVYPEPKDKETFVLSHIYSPDYDSFTLDMYDWPQDAMNVQDV